MGKDIFAMAVARFQVLTMAEALMMKAASTGEVAVCGPTREYEESIDPFQSGIDWGPERQIRAPILRWLCSEADAVELVQQRGVHVFAARVIGELDLSYTRIPFPITLQSCMFTDAISFKNARIPSLILSGSRVTKILADGIEATNNVLLDGGFRSEGEVLFREAKIGGSFRTTGARFTNPEGMALGCDRMTVDGSVFLSHVGIESTFQGEVRFAGARIGSNLECDAGQFQNSRGPAITADRITTNGGVTLRNGFRASGEVRFQNANIGTVLDCSHGVFSNHNEKAFNGEGAHIGGNAFFAGDCVALGSVHLWGVVVDKGITCQAGKFSKLDLRQSSIKGPLRWIDITDPSETELDLRDAMIGSIEDTELSWPQQGNLHIEGLRYERFTNNLLDFRTRLRWIQLDKAGSAQPYKQLAAFYSEQGERETARCVLYELEKRLYRRRSRILGFFLSLTIGYGYRLERACWCLLVIWVLGLAASFAGYQHRLIVPRDKDAYDYFMCHGEVPLHYQRFSSSIYSLEHSIPALNLDVSPAWSANTPAQNSKPPLLRSLRWWFWLQMVLGWALSIFFVAGLTGFVKTEK